MSARLLGLPAAPGIGMGSVILYRPAAPTPQAANDAAESPEAEWAAFTAAVARVDAELERQAQNENTLVAELFAAHRVILQDRTLLADIRRLIFEEGKSALLATHQVIHQLTALFQTFEDEYFAGRAGDILDLGRRLMSHLGARQGQSPLSRLPANTILLAYDLTPSELTLLAMEQVQGIGLANSTPTAHSAILAHSLGVPMVCTLGARILHVAAGTRAVVDGLTGLLLLDPTDTEWADYTRRGVGLQAARVSAREHAQSTAVSCDGVTIPVLANANRPEDVAQAAAAGADGIGLLRTEYLFVERSQPPSAEEQAAVYAQFAQQMPGPFVVRALDAGGDKPVGYIDHGREANPFLGLRGIRLLLEQPELLRTQYRALLMAGRAQAHGGHFRFLLPMISTVEELVAAHAILREVWQETWRAAEQETGGAPTEGINGAESNGAQTGSVESNSAESNGAGTNHAAGVPFGVPVGAMIEVPSAALIAGAIAAQVDFLSIGTNDLAQYTLASDRTNSRVARLADPLHPAVLHLIHHTCLAAAAHGKPVAVCGEIAGDPLATPLLLGLGVTELSAPLPDIALIKETVRRQTLAACTQLAQAALACATAVEVRTLLTQFLS